MPKKRKGPIVVRTSYAIITEESAQEGDYAEHGWEDEEGKEFDTIEEVVNFLKQEGADFEASSSCPSFGVWYSAQPFRDEYGDSKSYDYHIDNATLAEELEIYAGVFPNYQEECAKMIEEMMTPAARRAEKRKRLKEQVARKKAQKWLSE